MICWLRDLGLFLLVYPRPLSLVASQTSFYWLQNWNSFLLLPLIVPRGLEILFFRLIPFRIRIVMSSFFQQKKRAARHIRGRFCFCIDYRRRIHLLLYQIFIHRVQPVCVSKEATSEHVLWNAFGLKNRLVSYCD